MLVRAHVPARRRVRHQGEAVADQRRASSAASPYPAPARDRRGRRARAPGDRRRTRGLPDVADGSGQRREDHRGAGCRCACRSRPAPRHRRGLRAEDERAAADARCSRSCATLDPVRLRRACPHVEAVTDHRSVQRDGARRHAEPPAHLHVSARPRRASAAEETLCARRILSRAGAARLSAAGHRRPTSRALLDVLPNGPRARAASTRGIQLALQRMLASPEFLFRVEREPAGRRAGAVYRVSDLELASRLSFFLWSSIPDDELLDRGRAGAAAATRPCSSGRCGACWPIPRAEALVSNFAGQWLYLRNLQNVRARSRTSFPTSTTTCGRRSGARRSCSSTASCARTAASLDLLTADYTFVNERLARHYGIPGVYGSQFRRVPVTDDARRGLLGQGSILTVTSHAEPHVAGACAASGSSRTCSARRRRRRRRTCPPLDGERASASRPLTVRERMEQHRANPACAGCHKLMDPLGLRARELRRASARGAPAMTRGADRRRRASWRTAPRSTAPVGAAARPRWSGRRCSSAR